MHNIKHIEYKIFSLNRFSLSSKENNEIQQDLKNSNILILGAAGSIGSEFSKRIFDYNFKKLILIDKDENSLTELNRDINLFFPKYLNKVDYIVLDITSSNIDNILKTKKISHYFNFAAVKHVRSEENIESIQYMIKTNSFDFLPSKPFFLKKFFSISTDKSCNPKSILGISKKIMEINLANYKMKYPKVHVSSNRFANVAFSKGSILEFAIKRISQKLPFGVPKNIRRFFISHREACNLCFKSMLPQGNGAITIPNVNTFGKEIYIYKIIKKILKIKKIKYQFKKKVTSFDTNFLQIELKNQKNHGQKNSETFREKNEKVLKVDNDKEILILPFFHKINYLNKNSFKQKNLNSLKNFLKRKFKTYKPPHNEKKVSQEL
ncbi:polysaccharide biosynthesis protein [Candidatus Pelagibacter sp.]|nr:polysaccharide biosynthesis protein [Candidatus Pelagibacter sp.]